MQTIVENTDKHTVKLTIEVPSEQVDKDLDRTYRAIAREVKIPGFRPGKAPKPIIDAQVGREVVLEEFVHQQVPDYFRTAVTDEDLAPIGDPDVDVEQLEPGKAFIFTATVEVRPRLDLAKARYEGVKVTRPSTEPKHGSSGCSDSSRSSSRSTGPRRRAILSRSACPPPATDSRSSP
jgi:trigger factor